MFFQISTDRRERELDLRNRFAGPFAARCWMIGGGPSLRDLPCAEINQSPTAKMAINLAGTQLIKPTFWTAYDPANRFHRSLFLDPSIMKFLPRRRAFDLVPESTEKVCECPNLYFFNGHDQRGFDDFVSSRHEGIVDWNDSLVQAIDLVYQLVFRRLYLTGMPMQVHPSEEMLRLAQERGVEYNASGTLAGFVEACQKKGIRREELEQAALPEQYHFDEQKPLASAIQTDLHYFRVVQFLRLARRALSVAGVEICSVTPHSRLNDHFEYRDAQEVCEEILQLHGDPRTEPTRGLYTQSHCRSLRRFGLMKDLLPPKWAKKGEAGKPAVPCPQLDAFDDAQEIGLKDPMHRDVPSVVEQMKSRRVVIDEVG